MAVVDLMPSPEIIRDVQTLIKLPSGTSFKKEAKIKDMRNKNEVCLQGREGLFLESLSFHLPILLKTRLVKVFLCSVSRILQSCGCCREAVLEVSMGGLVLPASAPIS